MKQKKTERLSPTLAVIVERIERLEENVKVTVQEHPMQTTNLVGGTPQHRPGTSKACADCIKIQAAQNMLFNYLQETFGVNMLENTPANMIKLISKIIDLKAGGEENELASNNMERVQEKQDD